MMSRRVRNPDSGHIRQSPLCFRAEKRFLSPLSGISRHDLDNYENTW